MTNREFSNEFDVLYNNITSNQAPGLDEYEKSVFLTKAQDEVIKAYYNPRLNKTQEGFDDNGKRQIDFSMITKSDTYRDVVYIQASSNSEAQFKEPVKISQKDLNTFISSDKWVSVDRIDSISVPSGCILNNFVLVDRDDNLPDTPVGIVTPFKDSIFDNRENTKAVELKKDILIPINEYVIVTRGEDKQKVRLTVIPINYNEYNRLMSKPYKRPLKFNAWRLLDNSDTRNRAELIIGPNDTITQYTVRYVKRPNPIVLSNLEDGLSLGDNISEETPCELDPILHPEILQRAVELAKAAYIGDLTSQVALGQSSQTNMGIVTQSR